MTLSEFFAENPRVALGFSGGVDSSYLLYEALRCGADVRAYYIRTAFQPQFEFEDAVRLADSLGVTVTVIPLDILSHPEVAANPCDRCYGCKTAMLSALQTQARADGYAVLIDGTNASDDEADRPGMRALRERSVRSPLRECGLCKQEVRERSRRAGLFTWNKPAYACLATRIPAGRAITEPLLARVEAAESALASLGFSDFRIRVLGEAARIQLRPDQMQCAIERREEICGRIQPYFEPVFMDLKARE